MRSTQDLRAAVRGAQPRVYARLQEHRALTRLTLASLALAVALGVSLQETSAGLTPEDTRPASLLLENVGVGVLTTDAIALRFDEPMDPASVEDHLSISPAARALSRWSDDRRTLTLHPLPRWQTDKRYVVAVAAGAQREDGSLLDAERAVSFTTQTAPTVAEFGVRLLSSSAEGQAAAAELIGSIPYAGAEFVQLGSAPLIDEPEDALSDASSATGIRISFSAPMDRADVQSRFRIVPAVRGTFSWRENQLIFSPRHPLEADTRYAVSVVGAHDIQGNLLAGDVSFSFTTRVAAELVRFSPDRHARGVMARQVALRFSQPMNRGLTSRAFEVVDRSSGRPIRGDVRWNKDGTLLLFKFRDRLPRGHLIAVTLGKAARDRGGNPVTISWTFRTKPAPVVAAAAPTVRSAPAAPVRGPAAPADLQEFALWQINQARARHGFAPMRLDAAVAEVASAHAWDMLNHGYFSHTGRDGSRISDRLRRAGISFSWSGENICYYNGLSLRATLDWCHSTFMSEPWPGFNNHIGNILSTHYSRVGIGIAQSGGRVIIVWDFAG